MKRGRSDKSSDKSGDGNKKHVSEYYICKSMTDNFLDCKKVSIHRRLLESRSACLYKYLEVKSGVENVFTNFITLPIVCSFIRDEEKKNKIMDNLYHVMFTGHPNQVTREHETVQQGKELLKCNEYWNKSLEPSVYDKICRDIDIEDINEGDKYNETMKYISLLKGILGVINTSSWIERTDYYVNLDDKISKIDKKRDTNCNKKPLDVCEEEGECIKRLSKSEGGYKCINSQRFRTLTRDDAYYIHEDAYLDEKFLYRPVCTSYIIAGNSGIFREEKIGSTSITFTGNYVITFPPFDGDGSWKFYATAAHAMFWKAYIVQRHTKTGRQVGINDAYYTYIDNWYNACFKDQEELKKDANIYIVGVSLGGALANICAYYLHEKGYENIHFHAYGAPRVGDEEFKKYMDSIDFGADSYNYVKFLNVKDKNGAFYTQFDPVVKFPPNEYCISSYFGYCLRYVDNTRIRIMNSGLTFNPVFETFSTQPDYDMIRTRGPISIMTPLGSICSNFWGYMHSVDAYNPDVFGGIIGVPGENYYDYDSSIRDMKDCVDEGVSVEDIVPGATRGSIPGTLVGVGVGVGTGSTSAGGAAGSTAGGMIGSRYSR